MRRLKKLIIRLLSRIGILYADIVNKIKYGPEAPKYFERIWVNPQKIVFMLDKEEVLRVTGIHRNKASAIVIDWNDVDNIKPVKDEYRMQYCFRHWIDGVSWRKIGIYDFMSQTKKYGSWPREKIIERFKVLDQAFEETKLLGRLRTRHELDKSNFREQDGILVHIGENGTPYFGGNGFHRLAIAKVLKLNLIPACIGLVDKNSIHHLKQYRKHE